MRIGSIEIGAGAPLTLVGGINVVESEAQTLEAAQAIGAAAERHGLPLVFKASFDKANRTRVDAFRG
ncbi:MAG: 3-deoxy-8-phosphooctulonate synthase, partial [bacterium]|nr:3-deoxy-8-phosphooctulonate synthase [bacterium]